MKKGFQVHVTLTNGEVLSSDPATWESIVNKTLKQNPDVAVTEDDIENNIEKLVGMFEKIGTAKEMHVVINGESHGINPKHVLYVRVARI